MPRRRWPTVASTGSPGSDTSAGLRHHTTIHGEGFSMGMFRLYTGDDGESHMEELDLASHPELTALQGATGVVFRSTPPGTFSDWHTAPRRQSVSTLSGAADIGRRDGTIHRLGPGDVTMAEDLTGHGHTTRVMSQVTRVTATIHMEPSQRARVDRPVRPVRTKDRFLDHRPVRLNTCTEPAIDRDQSDIGPFFDSASYVSTLAILTRIVIRQRQKEVFYARGASRCPISQRRPHLSPTLASSPGIRRRQTPF